MFAARQKTCPGESIHPSSWEVALPISLLLLERVPVLVVVAAASVSFANHYLAAKVILLVIVVPFEVSCGIDSVANGKVMLLV
jgi:hypothetical protein